MGTNTGTDALILGLKALGIGPADEVITQVNTFYATAGAIVAVGARPVFVDVDDQYAIDPRCIEGAIGPRTKAILPVHWDGPARGHAGHYGSRAPARSVCRGGRVSGDPERPTKAGRWDPSATPPASACIRSSRCTSGATAGAVVTSDDRAARWLRLYRNHGMVNRDEIEIWGVNQRLQTVQAVVANRVLDRVGGWIDRRIEIADRLDAGFADLPQVRVPPRPRHRRNAFQLYIVRCERRQDLLKYLAAEEIEAKVHYPIPLDLQPAARDLGYRWGDFPVAEAQAEDIVTLPGHQFLIDAEVDYMIDRVRRFYRR